MVGHGHDNGDMPLWIRAAYRYGAPTIIALGLVWFLAMHADGMLHAMSESLQEHITEQKFFLRAICMNTATSENQRASCIPPQGEMR